VLGKVDGYTFKEATTVSLHIFLRKATGWKIGVQIPAGEMSNFSFLRTLQAVSGAPSSSYLMET